MPFLIIILILVVCIIIYSSHASAQNKKQREINILLWDRNKLLSMIEVFNSK